MNIGWMLNVGNPGPMDQIVDDVRGVRDDGFPSVWVANVFSVDALITIAVVGREVDGIEMGTAVVPTYPRHPMALAQQALTVQATTGGRLVLGIGLSHQVVIEGMFGYSFDKPARHMREYLSVLLPILRGEPASFSGQTLSAQGQITVTGADPVPVLLAALAPRMLELAGSLTAGTITWMAGPKTVSSHIAPSIRAAAEKAGRDQEPRIVVGLPVCVTDDPAQARRRASRLFSVYGGLPSYRAMLDREGAEGPADVAVVGTRDDVAQQISNVFDSGATDFVAAAFGTDEEIGPTRELLQSLL